MGVALGKKAKRHTEILERVEQTGYESIESLARKLAVSEQTIRRDIADLDSQDLARRTHGGVAFAGDLQSGVYMKRRFQDNDAKKRIAEKVAHLVKDGDSIFIDAGTTCAHIARALCNHKRLKVATYNLNAAHAMKDCDDFVIALPGGFLRHVDGSIMGDFSKNFITRFNFDVSILSVSGVDANGILGDDNQWEVVNATTAIERSARAILAVDSSKFGKTALEELGPISTVDCLVTNRELGAQEQALVAANTELVLA